MKQRIRHLFPHDGTLQTDDRIPRGWITPQGKFLRTKEHWASINSHFRRPDTRSLSKEEAAEEATTAERTAQLAYSLGWISVGHAGKLNAVAHKQTFEARHHPAVTTLRRLLEKAPALLIQIETQLGAYLASTGVHEDYELKDYDLDVLIKRGRLRQARE